MNWLFSDVIPALRIDGTGVLGILGTLVAPGAANDQLTKDRSFTSIVLGAEVWEGEEREALWSDRLSLKKLDALRESYTRIGQLQAFGLEFLSTATLMDQALFKPENICRYREMSPEEFIAKYPFRALCIDPAISESKTAAFCALSVVGMTDKGFFHVADLTMKIGMSPTDQVNEYFRMSKMWQCNRHGVEAVAYQAALIHLLREEMFRQKHYFEIDPKVGGRMVGTDKKKHMRVEGMLQKRYAAQLITHNRRWIEYETQLIDWPRQRKDGPDVVSMCIALLDPYAALASDDLSSLVADSSYDNDLEELPDFQWAP